MKSSQEIAEVKKEVKRFDLLPEMDEFNMFMTIAKTASKSGLYGGVGSEEKIFMILLQARELGIPPLTALNGGIWNIMGRIEISPKLMNAMIRRQGHSIRILESTDKSCTLEGKRRDNGDMVNVTFTLNDAIQAGLVKDKSAWTKYPKDMLYNRAMSRLGRLLFADCIGTAYIQGETRDDKLEEAEIIEMAEENGYKQIEQKPQANIKDKYSQIYAMNPLVEDYLNHCKETWKSKSEDEILDYFIANPNELEIRYSKWMEKRTAEIIVQPDAVVPVEQSLLQPAQ